MRKILSGGTLVCGFVLCVSATGSAQFSISVTGSPSTGYSAYASGGGQSSDCYPYDGEEPTTSVSFAGQTDQEEGYSASVGVPANYLGPGTYTANGQYSGYSGEDNNFNPCYAAGGSGSASVTVPGGVGSSTQVQGTTQPVTVIEGKPLVLSVYVGPAISYQLFTPPTGRVTLLEGKRVLVTETLTGSAANFSLPTNGIAPGTYQLTAAYDGDSSYLPSTSTALVVTVESVQQPTTLALAVTPNPLVAGDQVQLQATVTPAQEEFTPTGTVTFSAEGRVLGRASVQGGTAATLTLSSAGIAPGTYPVIAKYSGDADDLPSTSAAVPVSVVAQSATTTTVTISPSVTAVQGDTLLIAATVAQTTGDTTPAGKVNVLVNGKVISSLTLSGGTTSFNLSTNGFAAGSYVVSAAYTGSKMDQPSSSVPQSVVLLATTATLLSATPNPVTQGNLVFLTAKVSETHGQLIPTGTVTFSYQGIALGSANLGTDGSASLPVETGGLATGSYPLTATYSGDAGNNTSTSNTLDVVLQ